MCNEQNKENSRGVNSEVIKSELISFVILPNNQQENWFNKDFIFETMKKSMKVN